MVAGGFWCKKNFGKNIFGGKCAWLEPIRRHSPGRGQPNPVHRLAFKWFHQAAEQGKTESQVHVGQYYISGTAVPPDFERARDSFARAAENSPPGIVKEGAVVRRDFAAKMINWKEFAENGDAAAQFMLGAIYAVEDGAYQNYKEAAKWFGLAAERGNADAQYWLGSLYRTGKGVPEDVMKGLEFIVKAAGQGHAKAIGWIRTHADRGATLAQYFLASMYLTGEGLPQDAVLAHMWLNLAAAKFPPGELRELAANDRDGLSKIMTPDQIAEAQRLAREWKPDTE